MNQALDHLLPLIRGPLDGATIAREHLESDGRTLRATMRGKPCDHTIGFPAMVWVFCTDIQADAIAEYHLSPDGQQLIHVATHQVKRGE